MGEDKRRLTGGRPFHAVRGGVRLAMRVTPGASRSAVSGLGVDAHGRPLLGVRIGAPPAEGAANAALIGFLATELGLRKAEIAIVGGRASRTKLVLLSGDAADLLARLEAWIGG